MPRPASCAYRGLKLVDPETGKELFRCDGLTAAWTSMTDSRGQTRPAIVLAAAQADSAAGDWQRLYEVLRRRLECQGGRPEFEVRLTADQWILHDGDKAQTLQGVEGGIGLMPNGIQAQLAFRFAGGNSSQPVRMRLVRNRQVAPPANGFEMDTGAYPVPCRLLAASLPEASALGPNCRFSGYVSFFEAPGGPSGELSGQLTGVDLGRLSRDTAAVTGTADIALKARFQEGRIEELAGRIDCGPGSLAPDMLAALAMHLRITPSPQVTVARQSLAFDRLGLDFRIDNRGIGIAGHCADVPGAVAVAGGQVILSAPAGTYQQPVASLIQALVPFHEGRLARALPAAETARTN